MYEIEPQSLVFSGGKRCRFPGDIAEIINFDDAMVVRLVDTPISILHNVFGVDYRGNILWQIPKPVSFRLEKPYVSVTTVGGRVSAMNWDGHVVTLHAKLGIILHEDYYLYDDGSSSRRVPPPRQWL
jgi:hypothetical protein